MSLHYEWTLQLRLRPDTPATFLAELRFHLGLTDEVPERPELAGWPCLLPVPDDTVPGGWARSLAEEPGSFALYVRVYLVDDAMYDLMRTVPRWLAPWSLTQGWIGIAYEHPSEEPWLDFYVQDGHAYIGEPGGAIGAFDNTAPPFTLPRDGGRVSPGGGPARGALVRHLSSIPDDTTEDDAMAGVVEVVDHDPAWAAAFASIGGALREALGAVAVRIDHIGSTAVPGLAAKPVVDVQISVASLEPADGFRVPLQALGYVHRADNPERTKRYFREPPGQRRTHVHVRRAGSFSEQFPLLFRDYLRVHPAGAAEYAAVKRRCAQRFRHDRQGYVEAKDAFVWQVIRQADAWAQQVGWQPGPSDA